MDIHALLEESLATLRQGTAEGERRVQLELDSGVASGPVSVAQMQPQPASAEGAALGPAAYVDLRGEPRDKARDSVIPRWGRVSRWRARFKTAWH